MTDLDLDTINELLRGESIPTSVSSRYPRPEQHGPLRVYDQTMRCASKGCSSPTYYKLRGIPKCEVHALREMNEMLHTFHIYHKSANTFPDISHMFVKNDVEPEPEVPGLL